MTSKERIHGIFTAGTADRVGCFEQSIACSVASDLLGRPAFTGGMGLQYYEARAWYEGGKEGHDAFLKQVLEDTLELSELLGFDIIRPKGASLSAPPTNRLDEYTFVFKTAGGEKVMKFDPDTETWGVLRWADERRDLHAQVEAKEKKIAELDDAACEARFALLDRFTARVGNEKAVLDETGFLALPLEEDWLIACIEEPELPARYLDCAVEEALRLLPFAKKHGADLIWAGGDLADNRGVVYGPNLFRELVRPRLRKIVAKCHELGLPYVFRSDGNLWSIADDLFLDAEVDGYGEIEIGAGMDLGELRRKYPRLTFWGNVACADVLLQGSVEDVARETKICIDKARGGGHIVGSSNSLLHGTPPANVLAMFETAREYGKT